MIATRPVPTILSILLLGSALPYSDAWALHPSRTRLLFHSQKEVTPDVGLSAHFVPAGNLIGELKPLVYFGLDCKVGSGFTLSPVLGWAFGPDTWLAGAWVFWQSEPFWAFLHIETHPERSFYYVVTMLEYKPWEPWLSIGLEQETWGFWDSNDMPSYGGGPNLLMRFGAARFDLAMHLRDHPMEGLDGELIARFHIYF